MSAFPPCLATAPGADTITTLGQELFGIPFNSDTPEPLKEWAVLALLRLHYPDDDELGRKLDGFIYQAVRKYRSGNRSVN